MTIKTANSNFPWAYIREGLLSEGYLRLRFGGGGGGGLIFGRVYFWEGLLSEFYGIMKFIFCLTDNRQRAWNALA